MTDTIRAYAWFSAFPGGRRGGPPRAAVGHMLSDIQKELNARHETPVALSCQTWPARAFGQNGLGEYLACIAVATEPGELVRSLPCWFQWQHPQWQEVDAPPPMIGPPSIDVGAVLNA